MTAQENHDELQTALSIGNVRKACGHARELAIQLEALAPEAPLPTMSAFDLSRIRAREVLALKDFIRRINAVVAARG